MPHSPREPLTPTNKPCLPRLALQAPCATGDLCATTNVANEPNVCSATSPPPACPANNRCNDEGVNDHCRVSHHAVASAQLALVMHRNLPLAVVLREVSLYKPFGQEPFLPLTIMPNPSCHSATSKWILGCRSAGTITWTSSAAARPTRPATRRPWMPLRALPARPTAR